MAKRGASARAERAGLSYPPAMGRLSAADAQRGLALRGGHGGQGSGVVSLSGGKRPRVRRVDLWCFE